VKLQLQRATKGEESKVPDNVVALSELCRKEKKKKGGSSSIYR
jgi:hypothetical protein